MNCRLLYQFLLAGSLFFSGTQSGETAEGSPDFETEIVPLLINRCIECHQEQNKSGSLSVVTRADLLKGGDSGTAVDLKSPLESHLLARVRDGEMPPEKQGRPQKLPADELQRLERWLAAGAPWPEGRKIDLFERTTKLRAGRDWWSLQPIKRPAVPTLKTGSQPANPIDAFILKRLEEKQLKPAPLADKRTRLRRLYYDITGLPPTLKQITQFENDTSPDAWERRIDALLASPQYGERWARYWLDLVRYADTSGYERDQEKPFAWKYRDWVVDAFNSDLPYDRFILEQIAGDELPDRSKSSVIATGFLRLGTWNDEPNDPLDYQYDRLEDLVHTTSSAFLGMTVKCARCHSHKFDPITQEDYYRMASAFWAGPIAAGDRKLLGGPKPEQLGFPDVLGWTDLSSSPAPLHVLKNGEREHPLQAVTPASLSMIPELERPFTPHPKDADTSHRRLQLARWITNPNQPLTARVFVNRLWLHHFGEGIVRSPNNFGFMADPPTHPELLDWLAAEFQSGGGTIKRMHKLILMSRTWQQSSLHPQAKEYQSRDAGNRLWWRAERRRLDAEALRDSMLARTGELDLRRGGPGFRPAISAAALEGLSTKSKAWQASPPEEQNRRSLYTYSKRGLLPPMMTTFDLCDSTQSCGKRDVTTVPTQSLAMLNNEFVHARSETLAREISQATSEPGAQVRQLWERVYARPPAAEEKTLAVRHLVVQSAHFQKSQQQAASTSSTEMTPNELALASLCHVLFNSNEFLYLD
ncbi:PSD1 and planctomycete cytochrome C domain-containing protein [Gimesia fumaroli]|uniref:Planctomycete cytochrome C n=1 Tax=Gimesia fumaroli TaxID=2527976 RepID=A0A518I706_9PLAN|nr:PSD1 and planctomycete cytochrome C domain-containing protein [Gimesia fumaroli]QDV48875.1 Planctomycete cytochrome C [Gimesia fumaroli]